MLLGFVTCTAMTLYTCVPSKVRDRGLAVRLGPHMQLTIVLDPTGHDSGITCILTLVRSPLQLRDRGRRGV